MKKSKRQKRRHQRASTTVPTGVAWYSSAQWHRLIEVAVDRNKLDDSYPEWVENFENAMKMFEQQGLHVVKIPIDVDALIRWCAEQNRPLDGAARSAYAAAKVQEIYEISAEPHGFVKRRIPQRTNPLPFLDKLEKLFETKRDKSTPPPHPYDPASGSIRLPTTWEDELRQLVANGEKVEAVRKVTKWTGAGLRVSKDYVDSLGA